MSTPLEYLFPTPSLPKAALSPSHYPGISPESTQALQDVLCDNHIKWHIFFNEQRFHNHAAHRAIAAWALGADPEAIWAGYRKDCGYEKLAFNSPQEITSSNFEEHLGDDSYYTSYVQFFTDFVKEHGIPNTLEQFVFSHKSNLGTRSERPWMLSRFLSGVLHPIIHVGYGAEFELPGLIVEGLAMTAVTQCSEVLLDDLALFNETRETLDRLAQGATNVFHTVLDTTTGVAHKIIPSSFRLNTEVTFMANHAEQRRSDALSILHRVLSDSQYAPWLSLKTSKNPFDDTVQVHGKSLSDLVIEWAARDVTVGELVEELAWTVSVLYGIAGWTDARAYHGFTTDFFLMHLVTSSIFLPALCALLSGRSQLRLLKAYFLVVLLWAVARGQPALDIEGFVRAMARPLDEVPHAVTTMKNLDLWMRIIEEAQGHHDEHVTKTIRSLAGWAAAFGTRTARAKLDVITDVNHDAVESSGLGMGMGSENELGVAPSTKTPLCKQDRHNEPKSHSRHDSKGSSASKSSPKIQFKDADLDPRAWRDSNNAGDEDTTGFTLGQHDAHDEVSPDGLKKSEMPGSEFLDGGLFLRVAILTLGRMGWNKDGGQTIKPKREQKNGGYRSGEKDEEFWDFKGFFNKVERERKAKF